MNNSRISKIILTIFTITISIVVIFFTNKEKKGINVDVEYPEVYELANIILALTEYGKTDKWEVHKNSQYYQEMLDYFEPFSNHPILDSVNFSRKRWEEYLSFRTDAYAFVFDKKNKLQRVHDFQSFEIKTFDKYISQVQDFSDKTNFRAFFSKNRNYYLKIISEYKKVYMIQEMKNFLEREFGVFFSDEKYVIVLSVLVGAQNLHREIEDYTIADFVPVANFIVEGKETTSQFEIATEIHSLFTEMNHGYINPVTEKYKESVIKSFDESIWDDSSGYLGWNIAVFNEYMTWAVFDLFAEEYFPNVAAEVSLYWHFQNDDRGFPFSYFFAQKLKELYNKKEKAETISDLYPALLDWCSKQNQLKKPELISPSSYITVDKVKQELQLIFSVPLEELDEFNVLIKTPESTDTILINQEFNLKWNKEKTALSFQIPYIEKQEFYMVFNTWGTAIPLRTDNGILLKSSTSIKMMMSDNMLNEK